MDIPPPSSSAPSPSSPSHQNIIVTGAAFIVLSIISVSLRLYTRIFTKAGLGWDDFFISLAVLLQLVSAALLFWVLGIDPAGQLLFQDGAPKQTVALPAASSQLFLQMSFLCTVLYFTLAATIRLSVLFLYNRIFSVASFKPGFIALCALVVGCWTAATVATLASCVPLSSIWTGSVLDPQYCINFNHFWTATGAAEIALDVLVLALPVLAVLRLQLNTRRKLGYLSIFIPGTFVIATGTIRLTLGFAPQSRVPNFTPSAIWTTVHTGVAIISACLPILKPLLVQISRFHFCSSSSNATSRAPMLPTSQRWSPLKPLPSLPAHLDTARASDDRGLWIQVGHSPRNSADSVTSLVAVATPIAERSPSRSPSVAETENNRDPRFWTATATTAAIGLGIGSAGPTATLRGSPGVEARYSVVSDLQSDRGTFLAATLSSPSEATSDAAQAGNDGASDYGRLLSPPLERPLMMARRPSDWELDPAVYTVLQLKRAGSTTADLRTEPNSIGDGERT